MTKDQPSVWVAVNNYGSTDGAIQKDRELNPNTDSPETYEDPRGPLELAHHLDERVDGDYGFKINGPLVDEAGWSEYPPDVIGGFQEVGRPLFVDLKMYKGGGSMARSASRLSERGVEFTNAFAKAEDLLERSAEEDIGLLGLTVLTHHPDDHYERHHNQGRDPTIAQYVETAYKHGCDGVIMPPTSLNIFNDNPELNSIRDELYVVCPSIRPPFDERHNKSGGKQSQKATPEEAFHRGADSIVVGSPIYGARKHSEDSRSPAEALESILDSFPE